VRHPPQEGQQMFSLTFSEAALRRLTLVCSVVVIAHTVALRTGTAHAAEKIPLMRGLVVTTAIAEPGGDYESRKSLSAREDGGWNLAYASSVPVANGRSRPVSSNRFLHDNDLAAARTYRNHFEDGADEDYPGTTALGASAAVLSELKSKGSARFTLVDEPRRIGRALASDPAQAAIGNLGGGFAASANVTYKGELKRRSAGSLRVLVNGLPQTLPVVIADGVFAAKNGAAIRAELSLLDDPTNPLALQWRIGTASLRVVRIDFPSRTAASLSETLHRDKRVALPGLYFDFGSAVLKPESAAALRTILAAIRAHPVAHLKLEGHTDAIGDAKANLALSRARASAVRAALVKLDATLAPRLQADGFGAARPSADNRTLEGRAQNRRVELVLP
jgi:OmpA-OmpF porin, OOP family